MSDWKLKETDYYDFFTWEEDENGKPFNHKRIKVPKNKEPSDTWEHCPVTYGEPQLPNDDEDIE